nr:heavy-metal-associated domain-containing protein [Falsiroseomonas frigidaquae]
MKVAGMTCGHCVRAVTQAIQARDPQARVQVDLPGGLVRAETSLDRAELAALVTAEGYAVTG